MLNSQSDLECLTYYTARHCVFCGGEINNDEDYIDEDFGEDYD